jgi:hypothetical protein
MQIHFWYLCLCGELCFVLYLKHPYPFGTQLEDMVRTETCSWGDMPALMSESEGVSEKGDQRLMLHTRRSITLHAHCHRAALGRVHHGIKGKDHGKLLLMRGLLGAEHWHLWKRPHVVQPPYLHVSNYVCCSLQACLHFTLPLSIPSRFHPHQHTWGRATLHCVSCMGASATYRANPQYSRQIRANMHALWCPLSSRITRSKYKKALLAHTPQLLILRSKLHGQIVQKLPQSTLTQSNSKTQNL